MTARTDEAYADTNVCIALFAGPQHRLHAFALDLFRHVAEGRLKLIVTALAFAELVYVAGPVLGWSRSECVTKLGTLLEADGLTVPEGEILRRTLDLYGRHRRLDLADAHLAALALESGPRVVASFDPDFDAVAGIRRIPAR